jgi:hypothetical protein
MQMSKAHLILLCGMMVLPGRDCLGVEAPTLNAEQLKQVVLFAPKPYFAVQQKQSAFHPHTMKRFPSLRITLDSPMVG